MTEILKMIGIWALAVVIVAMPLCHLYANSKMEKYREHGRRTGEW